MHVRQGRTDAVRYNGSEANRRCGKVNKKQKGTEKNKRETYPAGDRTILRGSLASEAAVSRNAHMAGCTKARASGQGQLVVAGPTAAKNQDAGGRESLEPLSGQQGVQLMRGYLRSGWPCPRLASACRE